MTSSVAGPSGVDYFVGLIGLWTAFVVGVSVGIWLGYSWYRRMRKWADETVSGRTPDRGIGSDPGLLLGTEVGPADGVPPGRRGRDEVHSGVN